MTLNSIKNALFAAMHGMTPAEYDLKKAQDNLKNVTDEFLAAHPEYFKMKSDPTPTTTHVNKTTTKKTIVKMLGADAGVFKPHDLDSEVLERAKAVCRQLVTDNPDRYSHIVKQQGA